MEVEFTNPIFSDLFFVWDPQADSGWLQRAHMWPVGHRLAAWRASCPFWEQGWALGMGVQRSLRNVESTVKPDEGRGARGLCVNRLAYLLTLYCDGPWETWLPTGQRVHLYKIRPCWLGLEETSQYLQFYRLLSHQLLNLVVHVILFSSKRGDLSNL